MFAGFKGIPPGFTLRRMGCQRNVGRIRWNPMPAEGDVASHEDKEVAHWESREIGGARCSPYGSDRIKESTTAIQVCEGQDRQKADDKEAKAPCPVQE
jgi:hypothetical protein